MQCGWLGTEPLGTGQGWLGCRCPVPATWLDALWLAGHWCDSRGRGPTARRHWGQPQGRVHRGSHCHDAVGTLCPSSSGHLPTWGSRLGWRGDKRRLVTMVSAALPPPPQLLRCQPGCRLPPCMQSLLQPQQESLAPPATHRCVQAGACGEPEGQALPYGAGGPGDCGSLCRVWGWDPCLVTVGAAPGIARTRHSFGSGAESHRPGSCPACIRPGAAGSRPVPPAWHHVPGHPVPSGP